MKGPGKILIVEENETRRKYISRFLSGEALCVQESPSLSEAAALLGNSNDVTVALISIPSLQEHEKSLLRDFKSFAPHLPIVLITSRKDAGRALSLLKQNAVDFVTDSDDPAAIFSAVNSEFRRMECTRKIVLYDRKMERLQSERKKNIKRAKDLEEIYDATLENLMTALDMRDVETFGHSRTVAKYSQLLAQTLDINDRETLDNIRKGALLHDVGKIAIPDAILKKPTPLTPEEWEKIKLHPTLGYGLIKEIKLLKEVGNIILYHHEKVDGTGYPDGLKKSEIPLEARIFALADSLDAITSFRPYRKGRDFKTAREEIRANSGKQFDSKVVEAFCSVSLERWEKIRFETTQLFPFFMEPKKN
jgi:putative nucleotidyltransferase with HDIG domain